MGEETAWIQAQGSGRKSQVLEQEGPQTEQFRIKSADAKSYFATGFRVEVFNDESVTIDAVELEYRKRHESRRRLRQEVDKKKTVVPCYIYRKLTAANDVGLQIAEGSLELCTPGQRPEQGM